MMKLLRLTADILPRFASPKCSASPRTSYVRKPLSEMPAVALMEDDKDVEFG